MDNLIESVTAVLSSTPAGWIELAQKVTDEILNAKPAPGEWSALECLQHLVDAEYRVFQVRVRAFLEGRNFPAYDPDREGDKVDDSQPAVLLAEDFARRRQVNLAILATLNPADLTRTARHAELGPVTLAELLHEWAAHDLMHTVQAQRAMMQPFIAGVGPWRPYFRDHIAPGAG